MDFLEFFNSLQSAPSTGHDIKKHTLNAPRRRKWNDNPLDDFVAIDFETATGLRTSACALGMVKVIDGEVVQKYYTIINPVRDEYTDLQPNLRIHGIPLSISEKVKSFAEIFNFIRDFIGDFRIVCHNKGADIAILRQTMDFYNLEGFDDNEIVCTYQMTGKSLKDCCAEYRIDLPHHHDAMCDAEACAEIYLHLIGKPIVKADYSNAPLFDNSSKKIDSSVKVKLDDNDVENKDTIFYNAAVVITGNFERYPDRNELASRIQKLGAKINSAISKRIRYVVCGSEAGPKKMEKIAELQSQGVDIRLIHEEELIKTLGD